MWKDGEKGCLQKSLTGLETAAIIADTNEFQGKRNQNVYFLKEFGTKKSFRLV